MSEASKRSANETKALPALAPLPVNIHNQPFMKNVTPASAYGGWKKFTWFWLPRNQLVDVYKYFEYLDNTIDVLIDDLDSVLKCLAFFIYNPHLLSLNHFCCLSGAYILLTNPRLQKTDEYCSLIAIALGVATELCFKHKMWLDEPIQLIATDTPKTIPDVSTKNKKKDNNNKNEFGKSSLKKSVSKIPTQKSNSCKIAQAEPPFSGKNTMKSNQCSYAKDEPYYSSDSDLDMLLSCLVTKQKKVAN